jgi:hypothetical protein
VTYEQEQLLLWVAQTEDGLMVDDLTPGIRDGAVVLEGFGLLTRDEPIGEIQVFRITRQGIISLGAEIQ